jgi:hypothetical protein
MENPKCPVCSSFASIHYLTVKDHTVSGAFFELVKCADCSFVFTANPPSKDDIFHTPTAKKEYLIRSTNLSGPLPFKGKGSWWRVLYQEKKAGSWIMDAEQELF